MESKIFAKLNFDPGILVILSLIIMLFLKQSRLEANYKIFMKGKNAKTLEEWLLQMKVGRRLRCTSFHIRPVHHYRRPER